MIRGVLAAATLPSLSVFAAEREGFFRSHRLPIGLQLYTLGNAIRDDLDASFARIAGIGYRVLEPASYHGHTPAELRAAADRHGLKCTSVHVAAQSRGVGPGLDGDLPKLAAELHLLGVTDVVMAMFPVPERVGAMRQGEGFTKYMARVSAAMTADDWKRTAALLNQKGSALRAEGLRLSYHNHNPEFAPLGASNGMTLLLQETSPEAVVFELDVGWAAAAGADPVALLRQHGRRFQLMHVRDVGEGTANFAFQQTPAEIGSGKVDWARLLPAAFDAGVRKFYVELEPQGGADRFEAIDRGYRFLSGFGVQTLRA